MHSELITKLYHARCQRMNENKNNLFLQWWLLNFFVFVMGVISFRFGLFHEIYHKDSSYLCFVIMGIYVCVSGYNGYLCKRSGVESGELEWGWFMSELCLSLGMIGTVIGFIQMLSGFSGLDSGGTKAIQALIGKMSYGMSTALYTTLVGLIFGNILKLQCFKIERFYEKKERLNDKA